ncbi:pca operon transcription factor PcaQ [Oceanimonas baumannii]|uniref:LysR family pca operon transcriptional activator n=1 Tax=Oceanimonas baumannii TaxID=129578 RepID=A0A235CDP8_9GAMM|nr:pca operon transcription factor PcaQ [Oceanimonas baumannii]OYD22653.1 pca operon transcription factor PcaQ [Oceanimonas baumannii]TDW57589.1 LysR family pca operon transcriptional activator [Oceanimonas baumannii]
MIENRIKFRHLQCFIEVARQNSVSRAADVLALTQPAVSKKLKELEDMLEVQLLKRSKKGVELTQFGEVFLRYAGASITALREGTECIVQAQLKGKTRLNIGVLPTVAASVLPKAIMHFRTSGMDITLNLVSGPNTLLLGQLRVGELDLVVGRLAEPELMTGLSFQHLYSERITFVVRPGHPLLATNPFNIQDIHHFIVLYPTKESIIAASAERFLISRGVGLPPDRIETISDSFSKEYIRQSDAIWIISRGVVAREIEEGELMELPLDTRETLGPVGLTIRADTIPSPALQLFMNSVRSTATPIEKKGS